MILQLFECLRLRNFLEILNQIVLAEFLELVGLVAVSVDEEVAHVVIVYIVH